MAGSTTSSMTSSTLTHAPSMAFLSNFTDPSRPGAAADMLALLDSIQPANRHAFLQPSSALSNASLQLAKAALDAYAPSLSDELQQRHSDANKKRKRGNAQPVPDLLKVRKLHVDGFESPQVWQQAKRIITSTLEDSQDAIDDLKQEGAIKSNGVEASANASESDSAEDDLDSQDELPSDEDMEELEEDDIESQGDEEEGDEDLDIEDMRDDLGFGDDYEDEEEANSEDDDEAEAEELVEDPDGLNDGFFSIDNFNKQSQWFEDQDAKADPNTDAASDDEDFDWHGDPFASKAPGKGRDAKKSKSGGKDEDDIPSDMDDEDDDMDGGPTFGNADLDAPEGESENEEDDDEMDGDVGNANDLFYKDFFAPPQRKGARKNNRQNKFQQSLATEPDDRDVDRAMADVRRDLFEDESERSDSEDALSDADAGDPKSRRSAHERRQAKLAEEIRKLEAANVAKREWTMAGEAQAVDRPMNSLLEEDLDFEHAGKPVPVITAEVSESIEDMIKRRILAQEFDEVIRRRPDSADLSGNTRRGLVGGELSDAKNQQSLAEIYEEEHIKNANPDTYVSSTDERLRKDEREVESLWKDVCAKLDALSSWHYKPRPVEPSLQIVSDVGTVSMEDAQPTTAQGVSGGDTALAPQEIYKAGQDTADKGEVVAKNGLPVARQEMSREDKTRRRRRDKERIRKAGGLAQGGNGQGMAGQKALPGTKASGASKRAQQQKETLGDLKKGGVRVINKKGEVVDMDGNKPKASKAATSGSFKL